MYTYENKEFSKEQIIAIAKNEKLFLIFLLLRIISYVIGAMIGNAIINGLAGLGILVFSVLTVVFFVKMMVEMKTGTVSIVIRAFLALFPIIGLITLLIVNNQAMKILQSAGIKVGFLGASDSTIRKFEKS